MTPPIEKELPIRLDPKQTWIPISILVVMIGAAASATWFTAELAFRVKGNTEAVRDIGSSMNRITADRWTARDMRQWSDTFEALNPTVKMPKISMR